nr:sugar-binding domain-containing protein [Flexivirga aerilata]
MLDAARARGIVRIDILGEPQVDYRLSERLAEQLGLAAAVVVRPDTEQTVQELRRDIGAMAARELTRIVTERDVLGLPWSRTVSATVAALEQLPRVPVVQLSGALAIPDVETPVDVVRSAANLSHGTAHHFYAPLVAADADSAHMLRRQPGVADALDRVPDVTVAVVGVGGWASGESTLYDLATPAERDAMTTAGAIGEISGVFIDAGGNPVDGDLADRIITLSADQLRGIPDVIGLVLGAPRADVVRAAVRGGYVNRLVVDRPLAEALLHELPTR